MATPNERSCGPFGRYPSGELYGVACFASRARIAVGDVEPTCPDPNCLPRPPLMSWNGRAWRFMSAPHLQGTLRAIACTAESATTAVGSENTSRTCRNGNMIIHGQTVGLLERWDGTRWTLESTPTATCTDFLDAVSCASSTECTLAGYGHTVLFPSPGTAGRPELTSESIIEQWDGLSWTLQTVPSATGPFDPLYGVGCETPTVCLGVGSTNGFQSTLIESDGL
jgi:hypothetical protein